MKAKHRAVRVGMSLSDSGFGEGAFARHTRRAAALALVAAMAATPQVALATSTSASVPAAATAATKAKASSKAATPAAADVADPVLSGTCGAARQEDNVTWALTQNNDDAANPTYTLTISGTGEMADYVGYITAGDATQPWRPSQTGVPATSITKVAVNKGVSHLGKFSFNGLNRVTEYDLPSTVTSIGEWAIDGTSTISFSLENGGGYTAENGILFSADKSELIVYPGGAEARTRYAIPTSVKAVAAGAFVGADISNLVIPSSVETMYAWTFGGANIESVDIDMTGTLPASTFANAKSLKRVSIGSHTTSVGAQAFNGCSSLQSVSMADGITEFPTQLFAGCTALADINLPATLTTIRASAFQKCSSLASIKLPAALEKIEGSAFQNCTGLTSIRIPANVSSVGWGAFAGCTNLTDLTIAADTKLTSGVSMLGSSLITHVTFEGETVPDKFFQWNTSNLAKVSLPHVKSVGANAFQGCKKLTAVELGDDLTEIGASAFTQCTLLTAVTFPDSLTTIGSNAFSSCTGLTTVIYGSGITSIGVSAFDGDSALKVIDIHRASHLEEKAPDGGKYDDTNVSRIFKHWGLPKQVVVYTKNAAQAAYLKGQLSNTWTSNGKTLRYVVLGDDAAEADYTEVLAAPTHSGSSFGGWYTTSTFDQGSEATTVQDDTIYYAKWSGTTATVTPASLDLGNLTYGYGASDLTAAAITVSDGKATTAASSSTAFTATIQDNGAKVSVLPAEDLAAGAYEATIAVATDDGATHLLTARVVVGKADISNTAVDKAMDYREGGEAVDAGTLFKLDADAGTPVYEIVDGADVAELRGHLLFVKRAGTVKVRLTTDASANHKADTVGVVATLTVNKAATSVAPSASSVSVTYGDAFDDVTGAVMSDGVKIADAGVAYRDAATSALLSGKPTDAGSYYAELSYAGDESHQASTIRVSITIGKAAMTASVAGYSGAYDGAAHSVTVNAPAGSTVTYSIDGGKTWAATAPSFTNAGSYEVRVRVTLANHDDFEGTATVEIAKATVDMSGVSFKDATVTYDGTEHAIEVSGKLPTGVTGVTYTGNKLTHAGSTQATATFAVDANHVAPSPLTATLTVERAAQAIKVDKAQLTLTAGETGKIAVSGVADGAQVSWESSDPSVATVAADGTVRALKAGTVTLKVSVSATGDYLAADAVTVKLTVKAKQGTSDTGKGADAAAKDSGKKQGGSALPKTGDDSAATIAAVGAAGVAALGAAMLTRRRNR